MMGKRRRLVIICLASMGLGGCHLLYPFDTVDRTSDQSGVLDAPLTDARLDASADLASDGPALTDKSSKPTGESVDGKPTTDGGGYRPLATTEIMTAWNMLTVPCLDDQGNSAGPSIKIIDTSLISFLNGSVTLAGASAATKAWAGVSPAVTIIWDPNACGTEDPLNSDTSWGTAGLLLRGATIDALGRLVLEPWVTVNDINLLDVSSTGLFEGEFAKPDDSDLYLYPQLIETVKLAKATIIKLAKS